MNIKNTKRIPAKTEKLIYQEASSRCPFCDERDVSTLEIHHIKSRAEGGGNEPENLILCCANCHSKITVGIISIHEVYKMKLVVCNESRQLEADKQIKQKPFSSNVIQFKRSLNNGIVANTLHLETVTKSVKLYPPSGIIAANADERSYAKHLIDRYNDFKKADRNVVNFNYSVIYSSIKNKFKCKWDFVPRARFLELTEFLQNKIDGTILGKNRRKQGCKNYSTFDEYLAGYR